MKNKFLKIILISLLSLSFFKLVIAEEFIFKVSEIEVSDNGNTYRGVNKGKITTPTGMEIISDNFKYLKKINQLEVYGNAQILDITNDIELNAEKIFYLKNEEIIYTVGKTLIKISNKYNGKEIMYLTESKGRYISSWLNIMRDDYGILDFQSRSNNRKLNYNIQDLKQIVLMNFNFVICFMMVVQEQDMI